MYKEIALLCMLLLPAILLYLYRAEHAIPAIPVIPADHPKPTPGSRKKGKKKPNGKGQPGKKGPSLTSSTPSTPVLDQSSIPVTSAHEPSCHAPVPQQALDNHSALPAPSQSLSLPTLDKAVTSQAAHDAPTTRAPPPAPIPTEPPRMQVLMDEDRPAARVMRITSKASQSTPAVPYEDGWTQIKETPAKGLQPQREAPEPLTKKQRENMARAAKRKEVKAAHDAQQAMRRGQHQRQLEKERMAEFYSKGPGKRMVPERTRPTVQHAEQRVKEQLIWDEVDG